MSKRQENKMKKVFEEEIRRRKEVDENTYSMIGTELKRLRISRSLTLSSIANEVCSVSYLCKIENAKLKPNRFMLREICKKLNVSSPKLEVLFGLKEYLFNMINAFYKEDMNALEETYQAVKEFENYRSKLIKLIYYLYQFKLEEAEVVARELLKITTAMQNDELRIFMLFYSILHFCQENYPEALDNLLTIEKEAGLNVLSVIASYYILQCYIKLNHPLTLVYGNRLIEIFLKNMELTKLDYIRYLLCIYMINNDLMEMAEEESKHLQNREYQMSIELFLDDKHHRLKEEGYYTSLRPFARLIWIYLFQRKKYLMEFLNSDKRVFLQCDFSYNIANYLSLSDDEERLIELREVIIPNIALTNNNFEKRFFLNELCRISSNFGRYKCFCKAYAKLGGIE